VTAVVEVAPPVRSLLRSGVVVGVAMGLANVLQYGLQLVASHRLGADGFGGFGALVGLGVVAAVPMLALQTVTARHVARAAVERGPLLGAALRLGLLVTVAGLLLSPVAAAFLHVPVAAALALALSLGSLAVAGAAQGVLQGAEQFGRLGALFVAVAVLRVGGGVAGLVLGGDVTSGLAGAAVGTAAAGVLALLLVGGRPGGLVPSGFARELTGASSGVLALLALAGADLLLARHVLPGAQSGRYAAGSLVARACFWLPQFVAVVVVPRLASGEAGLLRRAVRLVAALGVVEVVGALLVPEGLLRLVLGGYGSLAHVLAAFALQGSCLAVLQVLVHSGIARGERGIGRLLWAAVAVETAVVLLLRPGFAGVLGVAVTCTGVALAVALVREAGRARR
jgi:hypothetical protein